MNDASFQPAHHMPQPTQADALGLCESARWAAKKKIQSIAASSGCSGSDQIDFKRV
jgi:hypothetical protein